MIDIFVRSLLGPWGQQLLDAYLQHSLWINGLILLYFAILIISRRNYGLAQAAILSDLENRYAQPAGKITLRDLKARLAQDGVPWEAGLQASAWPLIAGPRSLWPRLKNLPSLQNFFPADDIAALFIERSVPASLKKNRMKQ